MRKTVGSFSNKIYDCKFSHFPAIPCICHKFFAEIHRILCDFSILQYVIRRILCNFAHAFCKECKTYCSIAFEITTSNKESKPNMERAEPIWRRLFRIMFGFVVNLKGVWQRSAPFSFRIVRRLRWE